MDENYKHPTEQKNKIQEKYNRQQKENKKQWVTFITTLSFLLSVFFF